MSTIVRMVVSTALVAFYCGAGTSGVPVGHDEMCDCTGKLANIPVCGTDNFSYVNICRLKEAQKTDPTLGRRCLGKCPCISRSTPGFCKDERAVLAPERWSAYQLADFGNDTSPEHVVDIIGIEHAPYGEKHLQQVINGALGKHRSGEGPLQRSPFEKVCMTDGATLDHMKMATCAMANNPQLGVRCLGHCDECKEEPACPMTKRKIYGEAIHHVEHKP